MVAVKDDVDRAAGRCAARRRRPQGARPTSPAGASTSTRRSRASTPRCRRREGAPQPPQSRRSSRRVPPTPHGQRSIGDVQLGDVIGWFETKYARDQKHEARTFNLRLAASKLDGHVLMPGEVFDFNDVVGPRERGQRLQGRAGHRAGRARRRHRRRHLPGRGHAARRGVLRRPRHRRAQAAHATELLHQDGDGRGGRVPDDHAPAAESVPVSGGAPRDGAGRRRARGDPRAEAHARRHVRPQDEPTSRPSRRRRSPTRRSRRASACSRSAASPASRSRATGSCATAAFAVRERMQDAYPPTTQIWRVGTGERRPEVRGARRRAPRVRRRRVPRHLPGATHRRPQDGATVRRARRCDGGVTRRGSVRHPRVDRARRIRENARAERPFHGHGERARRAIAGGRTADDEPGVD